MIVHEGKANNFSTATDWLRQQVHPVIPFGQKEKKSARPNNMQVNNALRHAFLTANLCRFLPGPLLLVRQVAIQILHHRGAYGGRDFIKVQLLFTFAPFEP